MGTCIKSTEPAEGHWLIGIQTRNVAPTSSIQNCSVTHSIPKCCQSPLGDLAVSSTLPLHPSQIQAGGARCRKANIIPLIFDVICSYGPHLEHSNTCFTNRHRTTIHYVQNMTRLFHFLSILQRHFWLLGYILENSEMNIGFDSIHSTIMCNR